MRRSRTALPSAFPSRDQVAELHAAIIQLLPRDLTADEVQRWVRNKTGLGEALRQALKPAVTEPRVNPYAGEIKKPAWNYPPEWQGMTSWEKQLAELQGIFPELNPDGLSETAKGYLDQEELWTQAFEREGYNMPYPLYDGLVVFVLPGKAAIRLEIGDLWADVARGRKGNGLWGRLCEEIIFPHIGHKFPAFENYRQGTVKYPFD